MSECLWPSCAIHPRQIASGQWIPIWDHDCDGPPLGKRYHGWQNDFEASKHTSPPAGNELPTEGST